MTPVFTYKSWGLKYCLLCIPSCALCLVWRGFLSDSLIPVGLDFRNSLLFSCRCWSFSSMEDYSHFVSVPSTFIFSLTYLIYLACVCFDFSISALWLFLVKNTALRERFSDFQIPPWALRFQINLRQFGLQRPALELLTDGTAEGSGLGCACPELRCKVLFAATGLALCLTSSCPCLAFSYFFSELVSLHLLKTYSVIPPVSDLLLCVPCAAQNLASDLAQDALGRRRMADAEACPWTVICLCEYQLN